MDNKEIGKKIRVMIAENESNQTIAADIIGVSQSMLSKYIKGNTPIDKELLIKLCDYYSKDYEYFNLTSGGTTPTTNQTNKVLTNDSIYTMENFKALMAALEREQLINLELARQNSKLLSLGEVKKVINIDRV